MLFLRTLALATLLVAPMHASAAEVRVPYKFTSTLVCDASTCTAFFPLIGANRRLDVQFVSCLLARDQSATLADKIGTAAIGTNDAFAFPRLVMLWNFRSALSLHLAEISQPVVLSVIANQRPSIKFIHATSGLQAADCSISGELVFLS